MTRITIRIGSITGPSDATTLDRAALERALAQAAQSGQLDGATSAQRQRVSTSLEKGNVSQQVAAAVVKAVTS